MKTKPRVFLSYSHSDRDIATRLAEGLMAGGIDVWFDRWEIMPGDSLIRKIFEEGLSSADAFIVLISQNSLQSNWVRQELDIALVKRIDGVTRIIPVGIGNVQMPNALRSLAWVDISHDFDSALRQLQMAIYKVRERPPLGQPPDFVRNKLVSVGGLSPLATGVGRFLIHSGKPDLGDEEAFTAAELAEKLRLTPEETDDAVDELERFGLVSTLNYMGTAPFSHGDVKATYALFLHFRSEGLGYDPEEDIKIVASVVVAQKEATGQKLVELTDLSPLRINRAIGYLTDYGLVETVRTMGTAPFDFWVTSATGRTRQFVAEQSK